MKRCAHTQNQGDRLAKEGEAIETLPLSKPHRQRAHTTARSGFILTPSSLPPSLSHPFVQLLLSPPSFFFLPPASSLLPLPAQRHWTINTHHILKRFYPSLSHKTGKRLRLHVLLVRAAAPDGQLLLDDGRLHVPDRRRMCGQPPGRRGVHVLPRRIKRRRARRRRGRSGAEG